MPLLLVLIYACGSSAEHKIADENNETQTTNLSVDHFNIWVENPELAKSKLMEIGFRFFPDSLNTPHHGQGTAGKYSNFLNSYLELIYVNDQDELIANNQINDSLDFTLRADFKQNKALPFGIALRLADYDESAIPFETVAYHQEWMGNEGSIYSAVSSKTTPSEPSVFVIYPAIESMHFDNMDSVMNIPVEYDAYRQSFIHPNGAERVSKIVITSKNLSLSSETMRALQPIDMVEISSGQEQLLELYFDNQRQGKSYDLRPELPLKIYL